MGILMENNENEINVNEEDPDPWEICVEDGGIDVVVETKENDEKVKENILEFSATRNQFQDDLLELQSFLRQRLSEMKLKDNLALMNLLQKAPKEISEKNIETVERMLASVDKVNDLLCDHTLRMIIEIKASARYTERLVNALKKRLETAGRMEVLAAETNSKREELEENVMRLQLQKVTLVKEASEIKSHLQNQISLAFDRPVNIMGDI